MYRQPTVERGTLLTDPFLTYKRWLEVHSPVVIPVYKTREVETTCSIFHETVMDYPSLYPYKLP